MHPLEERLRYVFREPELLRQALCHTSVGGTAFGRLEFLGDRVLGLVIAHQLYGMFPHDVEGALAKRHAYLVSAATVCEVARELRLDAHLSWSHKGSGPISRNILADVCEAVCGAIHLDGGFMAAQKVVLCLWTPFLDAQRTHAPPVDAKSALQEYLQAHDQPLPHYTVLRQSGPPHAPIFCIEVMAGGRVFSAEGESKRDAEQRAAQRALDALCP